MKKIKTALTIAGSDSCGGAGIQADIKVFEEFKVYGMSVITALTAQNTQGISAVSAVRRDFFRTQLETVLSDIKPHAVKTGMIHRDFMPAEISRAIEKYKLKNIVCDTAGISKSGFVLCGKKVFEEAKKRLYPLADLITPNIPEAEFLTGIKIFGEKDALRAAEQILLCGAKSVLLKGGHGCGAVIRDYYIEKNFVRVFERKRIMTKNTHGTGCSLSAAISALMALGADKRTAVEKGLDYIYGALKNSIDIGKGWGPLNHFYKRQKRGGQF